MTDHRTLFFIFDYSRKSGIGHYMRCRSLYRTLAGFKPITIHTAVVGDYSDWGKRLHKDGLGFSAFRNTSSGIRNLTQYVAALKPDTVIIDSYCLKCSFYCRLKRDMPITQVIVFDDCEEKIAYPVNGVINAGLSSLIIDYPEELRKGGAVGLHYFGFRDEFLKPARSSKPKPRSHPNLLITFGGADPELQTERILGIAVTVPAIGKVDVIVGPSFGKRAVMDRLVKKDTRIVVHVSPQDIAGIMRRTDCAICGVGITSHELLYLRKPVAVLALAANQKLNASAIERFGLGINLGMYDKVSNDSIRKNLVTLLRMSKQRRRSRKTRQQFSPTANRLLAERIRQAIDRYHSVCSGTVEKEYDVSSAREQEYQKVKWGSAEGMVNRFGLAMKVLKNPKKIRSWLDVGCGTGAFLRYAENTSTICSFTGIDLSKELLIFARNQRYETQRIRFSEQNFMGQIPNEHFSLITAIGVLQKCGVSLQKAVARFSELLSEKGFVFITTKNLDWEEFTNGRLKPFKGHHWFHIDEVRHAFHAAGLNIVQMKGFEPRVAGKTCRPEKSHSVFVLAEKA